MNQVQIIKNGCAIGFKSRSPTPGPELDLVHQFIDETCKSFKHKENKLAIFIEPMVMNCYPDLVIAEYSPKIIDTWNELRSQITESDIKILQNLRALNGGNAANLLTKTNFSNKKIIQSLEHLYDAKLITRNDQKWKALPLKDSFYIKRLTSIEAKIGQWNKLHSQAHINKWFASESYALSQIKQPQSKTIEKFRTSGIGLYSLNSGHLVKINKAERQKLPTNYMSWMFNEWVGRHLTRAV
ncbi:hypothetical protein [Thiomicrospira sp.]|uniref:hypothetical protein n=1 Tax=Thiomicrospira sp. TaxID=935 RepID=UPI002F9407A6